MIRKALIALGATMISMTTLGSAVASLPLAAGMPVA
jgi:hypothetical protein